jgi:hypothetical protein
MLRPFYELFDEFEKLKTKEERIRFLRANSTPTLQKMMRAAFNPRIKFYLDRVPKKYKPSDSLRRGMADFRMEQVFVKIHLFELGQPEYAHLSYEHRDKLLCNFLEGMEPREAKILLDILLKALDVKFLTASLVRETWPGLLPVFLDAPAKKE